MRSLDMEILLNVSDSFHKPEDREGRPEIRDADLSR